MAPSELPRVSGPRVVYLVVPDLARAGRGLDRDSRVPAPQLHAHEPALPHGLGHREAQRRGGQAHRGRGVPADRGALDARHHRARPRRVPIQGGLVHGADGGDEPRRGNGLRAAGRHLVPTNTPGRKPLFDAAGQQARRRVGESGGGRRARRSGSEPGRPLMADTRPGRPEQDQAAVPRPDRGGVEVLHRSTGSSRRTTPT